ncbi:MAG: phycobiliprotein lyase [Geitlerinemataceae cyanobacterium]
MNIREFVERSIGCWRSQRSGHNLAFQHFEEVRSTIEITALAVNNPAVLELCKTHDIDPAIAVSPFHMSWEGESDWDEEETIEGNCILVPIPDPELPNQGRLLRSQGYAETIPAIGRYRLTEDDRFILVTNYDRAAAEEQIWFANPNTRFRVSLIKTSAGTAVITASFASEIRDLSRQSN